MRVVAVTPLYPPRSLVGAWITTHELLRHLAARGHDVSVFTRRGIDHGYRHEGVTVETCRRGRSFRHQHIAHADLVICHGDDTDTALHAHAPVVRLVHGFNAAGLSDRDALAVFVSDALRSEHTPACPSIVVHPPVDPADYATTPGDAVTIINCSLRKGVKVAWRLAEQYPQHRFLGVLGGYGEQIRPRARNFEVMTTRRDMRAVYRRTRVLLMPSDRETYGRTAVEAMCSGIPVIAHPSPGLVEATGGAAIYIDRDDTAGWRAALDRLLDPHEWQRLSDLALEHTATLDPHADLDRFAAAVEALAGVHA